MHVGAPDEPPLFLSMELLEGETLAERLRREGPIAEPGATELLSQVAAGLAAAHKEGVLHRDLKPSNVMLVPVHGGGERAVVTDFGIAQAMDGRQAAMTWDGPAGTPAYMAPEQMTGWELTPVTDLAGSGEHFRPAPDGPWSRRSDEGLHKVGEGLLPLVNRRLPDDPWPHFALAGSEEVRRHARLRVPLQKLQQAVHGSHERQGA